MTDTGSTNGMDSYARLSMPSFEPKTSNNLIFSGNLKKL